MTKRLNFWIVLVLALHSSWALCAMAPIITSQDVPAGGVGGPYTLTFTATAGTPPYAWSISAGALPQGLSLSAAGVLSGTPAAVGSAPFTIRLSDSARKFSTKAFTQSIEPAPPADVPAAYADLYAELQGQLDPFNAALDGQWTGAKSNVSFVTELLNANGNRGLQLLTARPGILAELNSLKSLGVKAVTFNIPFPILYQPFYTFNGDPADYQKMVNFYTQLVSDIRSRGFKIVLESHAMFGGVYSQGSGFNLSGYYPTFSGNWSGYMAARAQNVTTVAQIIKPDWLSIANEPDTEQALSGQPVYNVANYTQLVNTILANLNTAGVTGVKYCAGTGTWLKGTPDAAAIISGLLTTSVDSIDLHIYPLCHDFLSLALTFADTIHAGGKSVSISEAWMYKEREAELGPFNVAGEVVFYARDAFSFWAPLDQEFHTCLAKYSHLKNLDFCSLYWSRYYHAYLDYNATDPATGTTYGNDTPTQIFTSASIAAEGIAITNGQYTSTGLWYAQLINPPPLAITTTSPLTAGAVGVAYAQTIAASGGIPGIYSGEIPALYTFAVTAGAMPPGIAMDTAGNLSGAPTQAGTFNFTVQAMDDFKVTAAQALTLTVNAPPAITTQPASQTVNLDQTATFTVTATGTAPLLYQWTKNGTAISGATNSSYTTPAAVAGDDGAIFAVKISNVAGNVTSNNATLTLNFPPAISAQPANQTVNLGQTATFTVATTGTGPLSYQWTKNGANISGATAASYTTPGTVAGDSGAVFAVTISNVAGSVTSNNATLTVVVPNQAPVIISAASATPNPGVVGQAVTFSVSALDPDGDALSYSWVFGDGAAGSGSTAFHTYAVKGVYNVTVTVSDGRGATVASNVLVTINGSSVPVITSPATAIGSVGAAFSYTITATNNPTSFNANPLPTGLTINRTTGVISGTPKSAGAFRCYMYALNSAGLGYVPLTITINSLTPAGPSGPQIGLGASADGGVILAGDPATFTAGADDPGITYQWDFGDGTILAGGSGGNVTHVFSTAGTYTVSVTATDSSGNSSTSSMTVNVAAAPVAMTVSKFQGAVSFTASGRDSCALAGVLPNLPAFFDPAGQVLALNAGGVALSFTLDANGRGKSANGSVTLKLKPAKRDKATKKLVFQGGNAPYSVTLRHGTWANAWSLAPGASDKMTMAVTIQFAGNTYISSVTVTCSSNVHSVTFKK